MWMRAHLRQPRPRVACRGALNTLRAAVCTHFLAVTAQQRPAGLLEGLDAVPPAWREKTTQFAQAAAWADTLAVLRGV